MTKLLEKMIEVMRTLSDEEQDAVARDVLSRIGGDQEVRRTGSLTEDEIKAVREALVPSPEEQERILREFTNTAVEG